MPIAPAEGETTEVTKLAIGTEGGFQVEPKYDVVKVHTLVVMPAGSEVPLPCADLPELVIQAVTPPSSKTAPHSDAACGAGHPSPCSLCTHSCARCLCVLVWGGTE